MESGLLVATTLSAGSNPNSNAAGRRREDDENLVAETMREHPRAGSNSLGLLTVADPISAHEGSTYSHEGSNNFRLRNVVPVDLTNASCGGDVSGTLEAAAQRRANRGQAVAHSAIRRLTPVECERLQGFPDGWTEGFADSPRYRMLGNAVSVPVAEWLGRRIKATALGLSLDVEVTA